jgi:NAD-dependent deacetylase
MPSSEPHPELTESLTKAERVAIFSGRYCAPESSVGTLTHCVLYHDFLHDPDARKRHWMEQLTHWKSAWTTAPSALHEACALLDHTHKLAAVVTETPEGAFRRAGVRAEHLIDIQGSFLEVTCTASGVAEDAAPHYEAFMRTGEPPASPEGGWWKPGPLLMGESFSEHNLARAQRLLPDADLIIAAGSELLLQPASSFPFMAARLGVPYFVIHDGPTAHDDHPLVSHRIPAPASTVLPPAIHAALLMNGLL